MKKKKPKKLSKNDNFKVELVDKFAEEDFFDDCSVCQFEKERQRSGKSPTIKGLKNAFQKAKKQGAFVGGTLLESKTFGSRKS